MDSADQCTSFLHVCAAVTGPLVALSRQATLRGLHMSSALLMTQFMFLWLSESTINTLEFFLNMYIMWT